MRAIQPALPVEEQRPATASFTARVQALITEYFPRVDAAGAITGNVAEASRALGMSQRGLAKLWDGSVQDPRLSSLLALVEGFPSEDPLWIVTGHARRRPMGIASTAPAKAKRKRRVLSHVQREFL